MTRDLGTNSWLAWASDMPTALSGHPIPALSDNWRPAVQLEDISLHRQSQYSLHSALPALRKLGYRSFYGQHRIRAAVGRWFVAPIIHVVSGQSFVQTISASGRGVATDTVSRVCRLRTYRTVRVMFPPCDLLNNCRCARIRSDAHALAHARKCALADSRVSLTAGPRPTRFVNA